MCSFYKLKTWYAKLAIKEAYCDFISSFQQQKRPLQRCLLGNYLEENNLALFWSAKYSTKKDGENGWLLALKKNRKMKQPNNTHIGDPETQFWVHHINDIT